MATLALVAAALAGLVLWLAATRGRRAALATIDRFSPEPRSTRTPDARGETRLAHWLLLAGYRQPNASGLFFAATGGSVALGVVLLALYNAGARRPLIEMVGSVPGGMGDVLGAILDVGGWILLVGLAAAPMLVVRSARRRRVRAVENDLPLVLELLSTMAESGLGFDTALARVVQTRQAVSPLIVELAAYQRDTLAGIPRLAALRRLAGRVDVFAVTSFVSAVVHAEQVGASVADTLRHQAESLRERRREQALLDAQAMPVKLVFPLVICFLPGIFLSTLAPVLYQMIRVSSAVLRGPGR